MSTRGASTAGVRQVTVFLTVINQTGLWLSISPHLGPAALPKPPGLCFVAHTHDFGLPQPLGGEGAEFKAGVAYTLQNWPQAAQEASHHLSNLLESCYF